MYIELKGREARSKNKRKSPQGEDEIAGKGRRKQSRSAISRCRSGALPEYPILADQTPPPPLPNI